VCKKKVLMMKTQLQIYEEMNTASGVRIFYRPNVKINGEGDDINLN